MTLRGGHLGAAPLFTGLSWLRHTEEQKATYHPRFQLGRSRRHRPPAYMPRSTAPQDLLARFARNGPRSVSLALAALLAGEASRIALALTSRPSTATHATAPTAPTAPTA